MWNSGRAGATPISGGGADTDGMKRTRTGVVVTLLVMTACTSDPAAREPAPTTAVSSAPSTSGPMSASGSPGPSSPASSSPQPSSPQPSLPPTPPTSPPGSPGADGQAVLDQQLRDAAWADDLVLATSLIERGADVNAKDNTQQSAYLIATSEGHLDLLELTLANGALVDDKDSWNGTGLIRAAERGHALVVGRLLRAGIDRDHVNRIGYQAIHEAVYLGDGSDTALDTVRVLIAGGVELSRPSGGEGLTPADLAREREFGSLVTTLAAAESAPSFPDPSATLRRAATDGDADLAALALRAGADPETRDEQGRTPLLLAVTDDRLDVARLLVALGADVDALDDRHDSPWLVTGVTGSVAMLQVLLPAHPDLTLVNRFGGTALIPAAERGHVEYVRRAVSTGIDVNHVNDPGWTALLEAVVYGDGSETYQEIVRILLAAGADPDLADANGITALDHARSRGQQEVAALLSDD